MLRRITTYETMRKCVSALAYRILYLLLALLLVRAHNHGHVTAGDFVQRNRTSFIQNGKSFYVNGWNSYWLMSQAVEANTRPVTVLSILAQGAEIGLTVCRTWAFNDATYNALQISPGVYSESTFKNFKPPSASASIIRVDQLIPSLGVDAHVETSDPSLRFLEDALDFVIAEAQKIGVKLLLTLVNNLQEYGGKSQYVQWARDAGMDPGGLSNDEFFVVPAIRDYYKAHVKAVLTRVNSITKVEYREDPTIFGWELINEPRCGDPSGQVLQAWIEEMAAHVKSLDKKHLLTVGLEGFYKQDSEGQVDANPNYMSNSGTDFIQNHQAPGIDFATAHAYPDSWLPHGTAAEKQKFFDNWVEAHMKDAREILQQPIIFSEFGLLDIKHRDNILKSVYDKCYAYAAAEGAGASGAMVWQFVDKGMGDVWDDGFAIYPSEDISTMKLMERQSSRLKALVESSTVANPQHPSSAHLSILAEYELSVLP